MAEHRDGDTAGRILEAAIRVIERDGMEAATTRAIAEEASANLALINYYYRSKDALLRTVMLRAWENAAEDFREFAEGEAGSARERLEGLFLFLLEGINRYPRLTKALLATGPDELFPGTTPLARLNEFIASAVARALEEVGFPAAEGRSHRGAAMASAILYPILMPGALVPSFGLSLATEGERRAYVSSILADLKPPRG